MSKDKFKTFVKTHPSLASYVNNGNMTWQKFYEMYNLYGEENDIWKNYEINYNNNSISNGSDISLRDVIDNFKNMDLTTVQNGITNIQKGIELVQELFIKDRNNNSVGSYEPRPIHRYFDD